MQQGNLLWSLCLPTPALWGGYFSSHCIMSETKCHFWSKLGKKEGSIVRQHTRVMLDNCTTERMRILDYLWRISTQNLSHQWVVLFQGVLSHYWITISCNCLKSLRAIPDHSIPYKPTLIRGCLTASAAAFQLLEYCKSKYSNKNKCCQSNT